MPSNSIIKSLDCNLIAAAVFNQLYNHNAALGEVIYEFDKKSRDELIHDIASTIKTAVIQQEYF